MKIKTTASGNFDNKQPWSGLQKHMEHDENLDHDNKFLNSEESKKLRKYNRHKILIDFDSWTEDHFGAYVKQRDENLRDKSRKFGSVKRFLKVDDKGLMRKTMPDQAFMEKLSNKEDYDEFKKQIWERLKGQTLTKEEIEDNVYRTLAQGFADYADGFNDRNKNLIMFRYDIHLDEKGSPHMHSRVMPFTDMGKTKKGNIRKPSWSLNRALGTQYDNPGKSKANLKKFRKQEDEELINCMNNAFEKYLGLKNVFQLVRKTDKDQSIEVGLAHKEYKAKKTKMAEINAQLEARTKLLALSNRFTPQLQKTLENQKKQIENNQKLIDDQNKILNGCDEIVPLKNGGSQKRHVPSLQEKIDRKKNEFDTISAQKEQAQTDLTAIQNSIARYRQRREEYAKHEKAIKEKEKELKKREATVAKRESRIKKAEKAFYITFLADVAHMSPEEVARTTSTKGAKATFKRVMASEEGRETPLERQAIKARALFKGAKAFMKRIVGIGDNLPKIKDEAFVVPAVEKEQAEKKKEKVSQPAPEQGQAPDQEKEYPDF